MPDERYGKCNVCRYCVHDGDDWACMLENRITKPKSSCPRYRPGSCSNCSYCRESFGECFCTLEKREVEDYEVCPRYDPCGRGSLQ